MNIPTIFDWLEAFSFLRGTPGALLIGVTGVLIVLFLDWRLALFALIGQYLLASLLYFDLLQPHLAMIKLFVGMFVCLILYWTARQVNYGRLPDSGAGGPLFREEARLTLGSLSLPRTLGLRITAVLVALLLVAALVLLFSFRLPGMPEELPYINLAVLFLLSLGVAGMITGGGPLPTGMAVLTFLTGFGLYFAALDQSTRTLALLAALDFVTALVIAYLTQVRYQTAAAAFDHD